MQKRMEVFVKNDLPVVIESLETRVNEQCQQIEKYQQSIQDQLQKYDKLLNEIQTSPEVVNLTEIQNNIKELEKRSQNAYIEAKKVSDKIISYKQKLEKEVEKQHQQTNHIVQQIQEKLGKIE
ncbi:hypothetical protein SS50377_26571 [Spironucleus salmonicida]|uniref:Uncharacterized protein n=1 Tax=Spironucleus salmonicida TaxID=348837 RepID=A0A9P8RX81_9EUKA|nr:hypothetical protein SS50377_26571 [Spironucleus salmonicida]